MATVHVSGIAASARITFRMRYCPFPCTLWQDTQLTVATGPAPVPAAPLPQATPGMVRLLVPEMAMWAEVTSSAAPTPIFGRWEMSVELR